MSRWGRVFGRTKVDEARKPVVADTDLMPDVSLKQIRRRGYEFGVPLTSEMPSAQMAASAERQQMLQHLHDAYQTCTWMSSAIGVIARTVTAGGLQIVPDDDLPENEAPPEPPEVLRLRRLMRFTNPTEDIIQLLRNVITDLMLFGDSYIEVITLLGEPVAMYLLDATTMTVLSDQHGEVTGYRQDVDGMRTAAFTIDQVIHISLDAPRGGLYGVSPAQLALLPTTAWIFTMATIQETFRRGDPPRMHVDLAHFEDNDVQRWREQYQVYNLGPKAVGNPLITTGGGAVQVLDPRKVTDYLDAERVLRDQIIAAFGVPPSKVGVIETGNIGGGSGEAQNKSFQINTIIPVANLLLEKLNYHLIKVGFKISNFHFEFSEIDFRDSLTVEQVRELRLKYGAYSVNDWRAELGKQPIPGGDTNIIDTRTGIVAWDDMEAMSKASIANKVAPLSAAGVNDYVPGVPEPEVEPVLPGAAPTQGKVPPVPDVPPKDKRSPDQAPGLAKDAAQGKPPIENLYETDRRSLEAAWGKAYRARRREALRHLPDSERSDDA
jgi:HK97 family phage portal protein